VGTPEQYLNPSAFVLPPPGTYGNVGRNVLIVPPPGTYGNVGRNVLIGPGLATTDLSLGKNVSIKEKVRAQFRAEFFNLFNRVNFGSPNAVVFTSAAGTPSPTAGVITSTSTTSRQIQFGLKLLW
jgi:hypothetical protein